MPGALGYVGILPGHAPLIFILKPGDLVYREQGAESHVAVSGGFCEVRDDTVTVLADRAELPGEIDLDLARELEAQAEEELHRILDESYVEAMTRLEQARTWLQVGARR